MYDIVNLTDINITEAVASRNSGNITAYSDRSPSSVIDSIANSAENVN
ncbi:MAG TPA: hypothetical protein VFC76_07010 [Oscillospiraceae bacterium]|nr:hypothetical protein [Oscillospiraceae bacterium]